MDANDLDAALFGAPAPPATGPRAPTQAPQTSTVKRRAIAAIATAAAAGGALAPTEPAGWVGADLVLSAAFAAVVALATSRARRWTWIVVSAVAAVSADSLGVATPAVIALVAAIAATVTDRRSRVAGAAIGALAVQTLLRLPDHGFVGSSAVIVLVAVTPVFVSAYMASPRRVSRRVRRGLLAAAALGLLGVVLLSSSALLAQSKVEAGVDSALDGLEAARSGDVERAASLLDEAAGSFDSAHGVVGGWWMYPARMVPVVGQHVRALDTATAEGVSLTTATAAAARSVDTSTMTWDAGRLDLDQVRAAEEPLTEAADALEAALVSLERADSPWLVPGVRNRLDRLRTQVDDVAPDARTAAEVAAVAPAILGGDGSRRYLVVLTTPAEARGLGGFMGNYAELTADGGKLTVSESGRAADLNDAPGERSIDPAVGGGNPLLVDYVRRYGNSQPWNAVQDVSMSPDMPTVAAVWEQLYPQVTGDEIDGVIHLDPYALAELMRFSGPIAVDGLDDPLTSENVVDFLLVDQYELLPDRAERSEVLEEVTRKTFEKLTSGDLPDPRELSRRLAPQVRAGRLSINSFEDVEQALFERVGAHNAFVVRDGVDSLGVITQNGGQNKIDAYLQRVVAYDVELDADTGRLRATLDVELHNDVPTIDLPDAVVANNDQGFARGTNESILSVYTPHHLVGATIDGFPTGVGSDTELGHRVYTTRVLLGPGERSTVRMEFDGVLPDSEGYSLLYATQPLVNPDELAVSVEAKGGDLVAVRGFQAGSDPSSVVYLGEPREDLLLTAQRRD